VSGPGIVNHEHRPDEERDQDVERNNQRPNESTPPRERTLSEQRPYIDVENLPAPTEGILVTQFLTVRNVARARAFYSDVLGGQVVLEENPCIVRLANSWVIMNPGGPPTPDKPEVTLLPNERSNQVSSFLNLRVADIQACYRDWSARGAEFLTEPLDRGAEVRCYMRDPDGYLIEVGQSTGLLVGKQAEIRPEDLPADG
jgi:catechol 2,3-dioxygenase-like lactoylglutathione lyase family enzyme